MRQMFYKPANGWVGDIIPFFKDGEYKLFWLFVNSWGKELK